MFQNNPIFSLSMLAGFRVSAAPWICFTSEKVINNVFFLSRLAKSASKSYIRHKDFLLICPPSSVTLRVPTLDSETWWTRELWSKTNLLDWQN